MLTDVFGAVLQHADKHSKKSGMDYALLRFVLRTAAAAFNCEALAA